MGYQEFLKERGKLEILVRAKGSELMGLPLKAPLSAHEVVYTLPMLTMSASKGTGIVASVPSDSPEDFAALRDLRQKASFREKYGITEEMVAQEIIPIIDIPEYGTIAAVFVVDLVRICPAFFFFFFLSLSLSL